MPQKRYGSITAQDLYDIFIRSDALERYPWWELQDDEDDLPVPDDWYVVVDVGGEHTGTERRRLDADRLWMAILACGSNKIEPMRLGVVQKCNRIVYQVDLDQIDFSTADADTVMQVALFGQVVY